jgi:hypothetical protein
MPKQSNLKFRTLLLALMLSLGFSSARADTWQDVGTVLQTACGATNGGTLPLGIQLGAISNLDFLCTVSKMYGFVNNTILGGDWESFAREVAGKWITDVANYSTKQLGLNSVNAWTAAADDWMRGTYRDFKRNMMYAMSDAIKAQLNAPVHQNSRLPVITAGGLAYAAIQENPTVAAGQVVAQTAQTAAMFEQLRTAAKIKDMEDSTTQSIKDNVGEVSKKATQVIGIPGLGTGASEGFVNAAKSAVSTREVMVTQVEATAALMNQLATYNTGIMNQLAVSAKQSVMTNSQLMQLVNQLGGEQDAAVDEVERQLEAQAQETLDEAKELATQIKLSTRQGSAFFDGTVGLGVNPLEVAP